MNIINNKETDFRFAGIDKFDMNNGIGIGATLFVQYCTHHCDECQNKSTWSKNGGMSFTQKNFDELFNVLSRDYVTRLTLSGGDPLDNIEFSNFIADEFKRIFPRKELWIYTGYQFETLIKDEKYSKILKMCDVLIDGEFMIDKKDLSLQFRGSRNQRIINVQESLNKNEIVLWKNK